MEEEKLLVGAPKSTILQEDSKLYLFTQKSLGDIDSALKWATVISGGASLPDRYYEKTKTDGITEDRWPVDYKSPIPGLIIAVVSAGREIGLSPFASLNMIVPIYGKMAIKGDGAKALIFSSGMVKDWKESAEGDIEKDSFKYSITSTRTNGTTITQSFGVHDAKRADLWVTQQKLNGNQGAMHRQSPWYRYPARMCMYRTLGFISRDLYPDVLGQLVILEEINDYPDDTIKIIQTSGGTVALTGTAGKTQKSEELTGKAAGKIDKRHKDLKLEANKEKLKVPTGKTRGQVNLGRAHDQSDIDKKKTQAASPGYTDDQLLKMGTEIYKLAEKLKITGKIDSTPGKKSNKKYRMAVLAFQKGQLDEYIVLQGTPGFSESPTKSVETPRSDKKITDQEETSHSTPDDNIDTQGKQDNRIPDENFPPQPNTNPFGIEVSEIEEGHTERDFQKARSIYLELANEGINNATYQELASRIYFSKHNKITYGSKFPDLETFLKNAKAVDIHYLLSRYDS